MGDGGGGDLASLFFRYSTYLSYQFHFFFVFLDTPLRFERCLQQPDDTVGQDIPCCLPKTEVIHTH